MKKMNALVSIIFSLLFILTACSGGGGGGGTNGGTDTTSVTGKVTLSSTVSSKPGQALRSISTGPLSAVTGSALIGASVKMYDAEKPEWLYPIATATTGTDGSYTLSKCSNASLNTPPGGSAPYADGADLPKGKYTIIASNDITITGGKQYVAVQPYVKQFIGAVANNDLIAYDSDAVPAVISMFGQVVNTDGTYGGISFRLPQNAAIQVTFSMAMARISILNAISVWDETAKTSVSGTWKVSADLLSATFYPNAGLVLNDEYTVTVAGGTTTGAAQNVFGTKLPSTVSGTFTADIVDTTDPNAISIKPTAQTNVPINTPIQIASNEALDINTFLITSNPSIGVKPSVIFIGKSADPVLVALEKPYVYEIVPSELLQLFTDYSISVSGALDLAKHQITPVTFKFKTEATPTPPDVISASPAANATNIPRAASASVVFSALMDASSINQTTFLLTLSTGTVTGTVSYDSASRTAVFNPVTDLAYNTLYTATVTTGVKDVNGNAMTQAYTWSFTTVAAPDTTPPVTTASPAGGTYSTSKEVTLTSNETATIYFTTDGSTPGTSSTVYSGQVITISATTTLKFFAVDAAGNAEGTKSEVYTIDTTIPSTTATPPGGTYKTSQSVTLTVSKTASIYYTTDGSTPNASSTVYSGQAITIAATTTLKFFAEDASGNQESIKTEVYTIDTSPPTVSSTSPLSAATGVLRNAVITVTFSEDMKQASITTSTFTVGGLSGVVTYNTASKTASFTPSANMAYGTSYVVTISTGVTDLAGNQLAENYTWNFKTQAPPAPTGVSAAPGNGQNTISWTAVAGASSYNIYWSTSTGVTKTNGTKIPNASSPASHVSLTNGTTYYYVVTAVNGQEEGIESAEASAKPSNTPPPPPPKPSW